MKSLLAVVLACWSFVVWGQAAGTVDLVDGEVRIYDAAKNVRTPKVGDPVKEGESVVTSADSELHLAMADGGQLAIRPNTRIRIEKYTADGSADDRSLIGLLQGSMRSVTGWIGKFSPKNYQIRTPTATIGVRGTDHETHVIPPGSKEGEPGTYDKVNIGSTLLRTAQGSTEVRPDQAGFASHFGKKRPSLLSSVPTFFRPGRHESRFADLHEKVHKQLEQRRDERIRKVREVRTQLDKVKAEHKLERQNQKSLRHEQRLQQKEERRKSGDAGSAAERRQQFRESRQQYEAGSRHQGSDYQRGRAEVDTRRGFHNVEPRAGSSELRRQKAERHQQPASEHPHESGRHESHGGGHRQH